MNETSTHSKHKAVPLWWNTIRWLPGSDNVGSVALHDILNGTWDVVVISSYIMDTAWIMERVAPHLIGTASKILFLTGSSDREYAASKTPQRSDLGVPRRADIRLHQPKVPSFGTHHSKFILAFNSRGLRVAITSANMIYADWNNKSQSVWVQDFPLLSDNRIYHDNRTKCGITSTEGGDFACYLSQYMTHVLENFPQPTWATEIVERIGKHDFRAATVDLVASVPGYHRSRSDTPMNKGSKQDERSCWGRRRLHILLKSLIPARLNGGKESSVQRRLLVQCSSIGSLNEGWLREFVETMCTGSPYDPGTQLQLVYPTIDEIATSLEGWRSGYSIPVMQKNLKPFLRSVLHRWSPMLGEHPNELNVSTSSYRFLAAPHCKTYVNYTCLRNQDVEEVRVEWLLATSANLSMAAWGQDQKNRTQYYVRNYELGVLFTPKRLKWAEECKDALKEFSCTPESATPIPIHTGVGHPLTAVFCDEDEDNEKGTSLHSILDVKDVSGISAPRTTDAFNTENVTATISNYPQHDLKAKTCFRGWRIAIPFSLPPLKYQEEDVPWYCDGIQTSQDIHGQTYPTAPVDYFDPCFESRYATLDLSGLDRGWPIPTKQIPAVPEGSTTQAAKKRNREIIEIN